MPTVVPISEEMARDATAWCYAPPYDFYNGDGSAEAIREFMMNEYMAVLDQDFTMMGFYCCGSSAQVPVDGATHAYDDVTALDIGVGMRPNLTGKGLGTAFFQTVLDHVEAHKQPGNIRLTVAEFNKRAIHLYEKFRFRRLSQFRREECVFITMIRKSDVDASEDL